MDGAKFGNFHFHKEGVVISLQSGKGFVLKKANTAFAWVKFFIVRSHVAVVNLGLKCNDYFY